MQNLWLVLGGIGFILLITFLGSLTGNLESTDNDKKQWTLVGGSIGFVISAIVIGIVYWRFYSKTDFLTAPGELKTRLALHPDQLEHLSRVLPL